jgi:glycosyltransferase involved in cell wall biosynthesis
MADNIRVIVWMNMPSHHQSSFFKELSAQDIEFKVLYMGRVTSARKREGWVEPVLNPWEHYIDNLNLSELNKKYNLLSSIHIVPGWASFSLVKLLYFFIKNKACWIHWSERSMPGFRWYVTYPLKRIHSFLINKYALCAFAICENAKRDFIKKGIKEEKIEIMTYSIEPLSVSIYENKNAREFVENFDVSYLYVGRLSNKKGTDVLINAFAEAKKSAKNIGLMLVGYDLSKGGYDRLINKLGLPNSVVIMPAVPSSEVPSIIRQFDVIVMPSRYDGWGMLLSEAAVLNKALISNNNVGSAAHLIHSDNGYIVPSGDVHALTEAMLEYARNPEKIKQHGMQSHKYFDEITPQKNAAKLIGIIKKRLAKGCL